MSWQGDQEQPQSAGRGRRRRGDSPSEEPQAAAQGPGGAGRRGTGEFERPAEYAQYAEQQAAAYDEGAGAGPQAADYAPYQGYGYRQEPTGYAGQPGQADAGFGDTGHGAPGYGASGYGATGYGATGQVGTGYGDTGHGAAGYETTGAGSATGYGTAASGYGDTGYSDTGYGATGYADTGYGRGYGDTGYADTGYTDTGYGYGQSPQSPANLDSSGFYQLAQPAAPPQTAPEPAPAAPPPPYGQQPVIPQQPAPSAEPSPLPQYWQRQTPAEAPQQAPDPAADPRGTGPHVTGSHLSGSHLSGSHLAGAHVIDSRIVQGHVVESGLAESGVAEAPPAEPPAAEARPEAEAAPRAAAKPKADPKPQPAAEKVYSEKPVVPGAEEDISGFLNFVESRAESRLERARRARFRLIALGVLVAVIVGGTGVWAFLSSGSAKSKATQTTVLLQVRDTNENAIGSAVLVADKNAVAGKPTPTGAGAALYIPAELSVENTELESQPFGGAMPDTPPAGKDELSNLIGVDVDGVWTVDQLTFAAFLDNLGGVFVDVAAPMTGADGRVLIPAGKHVQLDGTQAVAYVVQKIPGEAPSARLARFGQVVNAMLARIPSEKTTETLLNSMAVVPDPALPNDRLAAILAALGAEVQAGHYQAQTLPVRQDGSGMLDLDAASKVVAQLLRGAAHSKDDGGLTRVAVTDETGRRETASSIAMAASKLMNGAYTPLMLGTGPSVPTTYVEVPNAASQELGKEIASSLGLGDNAVRVVAFDTTLVDARVVLGKDWTQIGQVPADIPSDLSSVLPSDQGTSSAAGGATDGASGAAPGVPAGTPSGSSTTKPTAVRTTPKGKQSSAKP